MRIHPLSLALIAASAIPAHAATGVSVESPAGEEVKALERVVVVATRSERAIVDVPNTVDEIDRARMDARLVRDLKDLFRYEPGISVGSSFGRFGIGDIRIRGLGGNRVRIQTDGIAVPDAFSIGSFSSANRNFVDLDTLKRVEVVRGPSSSLYGSDALGGTVSFVTKDPSDYLKAGKDAYFGFKLGVDGQWDGLFSSTTVALRGARWSGLVAIGHRQGQAPRNQGEVDVVGASRTAPNPQDRAGGSVLGKWVFAPSDRQRLTLTAERNEEHADTDMLASLGYQSLTRATNTRVAARDDQQRERLSLAQEVELDHGLADAIDWKVYRQDSRTTQDTVEERQLPAPSLQDVRERWFDFRQRTTGIQANARKSLGDATTHDVVWGVDVARTKTLQRRDGLRSFPLTGASTPNMPPDNFPVRDFPISTTTNAALYVQDEIGLAGGRLRLVPALRVDRYRLQPESDPIFAEDNPGVALAKLSKTSLSPKFGAVWHLDDNWSLFGGYARGFRAPPYADVNIGFTNVQFGYTAIANPGLKPETSDGLEIGLRYSGLAAYASLSAYDNRYRDFIESLVFTGFNPQGLMVFQSQNVANARIQGVELKAGVELEAFGDRLSGWSLGGAATWSRGENRTSGQSLESVDPPTATLGIAYARPRWGLELASRFAARRNRLPDAPAGTAYFQSPGYGVLDLYGHWNIAEKLRFNVGVTNLADRKYWPAGAIPLVASTSITLDRYTASGRSLSASVSFDW